MKKATAVVIGAGARGRIYADYAQKHPDELKLVAVAEPDDERLFRYARENHIPPEACFHSWEELLKQPRLADAALICTMDRMHFAPCMAAMEKGYHVLLEKPMSNIPQECVQMQQAAERNGVILAVCHVLRYTPFYFKIKQLVEAGVLGDIEALQQTEQVAYWHQAHSFVRGNWRNSDETAPMILSKCCHDLDIISWLINAECTHISSFGSLSHFKAENAPEGAPERCTDGCPASKECPYYAPKLYLTADTSWPTDTICVDMSFSAREKALREGPYGRCVYHCDNNVVDHQTVDMQFANGAAANLIMTAFSSRMTRTIHIMGTKAELIGDMDACTITLYKFGEDQPTEIPVALHQDGAYGHGGGDAGLMKDFVLQVRGLGEGRTSASRSMRSHLMCFAAEEARTNGTVVKMDEFINQFKK